MLQRWKILISNWINCYFSDEDKKEIIDIDTLVNIISHLKENLNFDESKSSALRAHTVKEFILEKYPQFKFDNGTLKVTNEEEVYLAASLLLFFVCVNSKEIDIKSAMCSRLSTDDQKTILKYSKCLLESPAVTCRSVQAAILEACGQDQASMVSSQLGMLDTPPALRSLHSEVRRLQAALDAERFDRNYLQEELARKNLKMDKLMKIKEQYKLEIMDLKAKISLCGQNDEANGFDCEADKSSKLMKQLKEIEDRLEHTQGQLDDVLYERDMYKSQMEDLKKDRDKWLTLSQQETDRVLQLTQELEIERRDAQTLKEVVAELRQHNRLNGLDLSQLECDDLETSIQSLQHNISGCSEVCANVVEVQLGEERAKIIVLKQQIETLQVQINDLKTIATSEKQSYEETIKEKECELNNLKHQLNEEFEENNNLQRLINDNFEEIKTLKLRLNEEINNKNNLEEHFNCEVIKLNNEVNELEQRLKDNAENARKIIETKFDEIKVLHEEKISLLDSLSNEINKRDNIITDLQSDLENEKLAKTSMKDTYENKIMKLNEKVLKRNNELVELQNNVCEKSEMIEYLHLELKKEKESKQELIEKYSNDIKQLAADKDLIKKELCDKYTEVEQLMSHLNEKDVLIAELKYDLESFKVTVHDLTDNCKTLEAAKANLIRDMEAYNSKFEKMCKDMNNLTIAYKEDKNKSQQDLDEKNAIIDALQMQLQEEIEFKIVLQNDMSLMTQNKVSLDDEVDKLSNSIKEKDRSLRLMEINLQKEVDGYEMLIKERDKLKADLDKYINDCVEFTNFIQSLKAQHEGIINSFNQQLNEKSILIEELNSRILEGIKKKYSYEDKIKNLGNEKDEMEKEITQKSDHITQYQTECDKLTQISERNKLAIKSLEEKVKAEKQKQDKLITDFEAERLVLKNMVTVTESVMDDQKTGLNNIIDKYARTIDLLQEEVKNLIQLAETDKKLLEDKLNDKDIAIISLLKELCDVKEDRDKVIKNVEMEKQEFNQKIIGFSEELQALNDEIQKLTSEKHEMEILIVAYKEEKETLYRNNDELKIKYDSEKFEMENTIAKLAGDLNENSKVKNDLELTIKEQAQHNAESVDKLETLGKELNLLKETKNSLESEKSELLMKFEVFKKEIDTYKKDKEVEIDQLKNNNMHLFKTVEESKTVITNLEQQIEQNKKMCNETLLEQLTLTNKLSLTFEDKKKAEQELNECQKQLNTLMQEIDCLKEKLSIREQNLIAKDRCISNLSKEKDAAISAINKELLDEKTAKEELQQELVMKTVLVYQLQQKLEELNYDKDVLNALKKENEELMKVVQERETSIKSLEDNVKAEKRKQDKLITHFEAERLVLKNMVTVTESVMDDQKIGLNNIIDEHVRTIDVLQEEVKSLKQLAETDKKLLEDKLNDKDIAISSLLKELCDVKEDRDKVIKKFEMEKQEFNQKIIGFSEELQALNDEIQKLTSEKHEMEILLVTYKEEKETLYKNTDELKNKYDSEKFEMENTIAKLAGDINENSKVKNDLELTIKEQAQHNAELVDKLETIEKELNLLKEAKNSLESDKSELLMKFEVVKKEIDTNKKDKEEIDQLKKDNMNLFKTVEESKTVITNLEQQIEQNKKMCSDTLLEQLTLTNKLSLTLEDKKKVEQALTESQKQMNTLMKEIDCLKEKLSISEQDLIAKDRCISNLSKEKDAVISAISKELLDEKTAKEKLQQELEMKTVLVYELQQKLEELNYDKDVLTALKKENDELMKVAQERETLLCQERLYSQKCSSQVEKEHQIKVDKDSSSDITQSSLESIKTINDLEKIIHDKNRTITTLQSDITFLKTIMAESETKLLDVTRDLEVSNENCQQLSNQLKKIVYQKNEEIAELKKQVNKMSAMENRASQIIKVSAKYQAIILKRIAEIKSNTVLKELTNYGNTNSCDNELRRSLNVGTITMEDLENFLETTDRHLKRCSEKQIILQKERDRLYEVNKIHESEIINLRKFLTELSVSISTFNSVKDLYTQKLSRVVSIQRTVRREILNLDGQVTDNCMCKLERGYAAVMQDLSECAMNLERWVERCVSRSISPEKIKQAFSDSLSISGSFQNAGLEVQLEELEKSFQKLMEEVARAQRGEGARDAQSVTVMEVKAEYEDKLNRMKAKMKQLFNEQMSVMKEKQRAEIVILEQELMKARETLARTSRGYEEHIKKLTTELWTVGEKFLMTKDEAEWLKRKQKSGSLMSLQHVHSSGLVPPVVEPSRPSDSMSLRSLPTNNENKTNKEGRGLHMSDEEGEVFDNRWLKELSATPRREGRDTLPAGQRLSELKWRNSLCPPHLKSSYPAETQFAPALDEEDIKCLGTIQGKQQRKEVGITAYKKPGPPTPSKQAGRLSATDSELRESLRVEGDPHASRKTSTPSRLRLLFRSSKVETAEGTPRSRRISNIFRKK